MKQEIKMINFSKIWDIIKITSLLAFWAMMIFYGITELPWLFWPFVAIVAFWKILDRKRDLFDMVIGVAAVLYSIPFVIWVTIITGPLHLLTIIWDFTKKKRV